MLVYLTGAAGFLGSHLCDRLLADGATVVGIDNLITGSRRNLASAEATGRFTFVEADVATPWDSWTGRLRSELRTPQLVMHFASPASPADYGRYPLETMQANALGVMNAVEVARAGGARILFASTSESYGDPLEHPQRETYWGNVNPVGVRACYDESKRYGEAYLTSAVRLLGIDGRVARIFNTYGTRMRSGDGRVVPSFCIAAIRGAPFPIYGDGSQTRSFCYVDDLVEGLMRLATLPGLAGRVVNLGNADEYSMRELAQSVARVAGVPLQFVEQPRPPDDPTRRRPDLTLARELLGWQPVISIETGLARTLDFFRAESALGVDPADPDIP